MIATAILVAIAVVSVSLACGKAIHHVLGEPLEWTCLGPADTNELRNRTQAACILKTSGSRDLEVVILSKTNALATHPGFLQFTGLIPTAAGPATQSNGVLEVQLQEIIQGTLVSTSSNAIPIRGEQRIHFETNEQTEQSDREATSGTALGAVPEASHP